MISLFVIALALGSIYELPSWEFAQINDLYGWRAVESVHDLSVNDGALQATVSENAMLATCDGLSFESRPNQFIEIRLKSDKPGSANLFWAGDEDFAWTNRATYQIKGLGEWETVIILPLWQSTKIIKKLRLDALPNTAIAIDYIRIKSWNNDVLAIDSHTSWTFNGDLTSWRVHPDSIYFMSPPLSAPLAGYKKRIAAIQLQSETDASLAVVYALGPRPGLQRQSFTIRQDSANRFYNAELELPPGRAGQPWVDPLVAIGLEIPKALQSKIHIQSICITDAPTGPAQMALRYFGFEQAVNRSNASCQVTAEFENIGGSQPEKLEAALVLPKGLTLTNAEPVQRLTALPGERATLSWFVMAKQPGSYDVELQTQGDGDVPNVSTRLVFTESLKPQKAAYVPKPQPVPAEMDVFMYYFPGWETSSRWDCVRKYDPQRKPWLGYYNEGNPEVVDWQIKAAVENGISGFFVDWYWKDGAPYLQHWLNAYEKAQYRDNLKILLMWCNHIGIQSVDDMRTMSKFCAERYFGLDTYYRIDGKPVFAIWDSQRLRQELGGSEKVRIALDACEQEVREAGFPGVVFIESGMTQGPWPEYVSRLAQEGYDAFTTYHDWLIAQENAVSTQEIQYADVVQTAPASWTRSRSIGLNAGITYIPIIETGWDSRPWHGELLTNSIIQGRTPELFEQLLNNAKEYWKTCQPPFILLGPANEWGEGSYIEPCVQFGFGMYEAVRKALATTPSETWPVNIAPGEVGLGPYDAPIPPTLTSWTFEKNAEGWQPLIDIMNFNVNNGMLSMQTRSRNAAIEVYTQINTDTVSTATIHMQLEGPVPEDAMGQLYWSNETTDAEEIANVKFPLIGDGKMHEYKLDLKANPYWIGKTNSLQLRICSDPGVSVWLDEIQLR